MARFRYLGEKARPNMVVSYGPTLKFRVPTTQGGVEYEALDPILGFIKGQDIGIEVVDANSLRSLRVDTRFEEIT